MALGVCHKHLFPKTMKRYILLIALSIFSLNAIHAEITWTLSDDGTLTISGTDMPNYNYPDYAPWYSQRDKIQKVVIGNGVTNIGNYAFYYCYRLTSVTIPNSVTCIGDYAFIGCSNLTSVTIPISVTSIGDYTFSGCSSLTSIKIPETITNIGQSAFYECSSLTSLTIPNSVKSIGVSAFRYCTSLTSITIPNSVTSIEEETFEGCSGIKSVIIPNSVTNIGEYAFENCPGLTSVNIPNSVMSIGKGAFCSCYGLISVIIPNSVTSIGEGVFHSCKNLTSVTIPNSVTSIKEETFEGCSGLKSVIIPNSVTSIEDEVFKGCSSLKSITCEANTPPTFLLEYESQVFYNVDRSIPVYVPANSVDQYKAADEWKEFTNIQAIPDVNTLIDEKSFNANSFPGPLKVVGDHNSMRILSLLCYLNFPILSFVVQVRLSISIKKTETTSHCNCINYEWGVIILKGIDEFRLCSTKYRMYFLVMLYSLALYIIDKELI